MLILIMLIILIILETILILFQNYTLPTNVVIANLSFVLVILYILLGYKLFRRKRR